MKKIFSVLILSLVFGLSSCTVTKAGYYSPAYNDDYVYAVNYYGFRPYWSNNYYYGYNWGNPYWFTSRPLITPRAYAPRWRGRLW